MATTYVKLFQRPAPRRSGINVHVEFTLDDGRKLTRTFYFKSQAAIRNNFDTRMAKAVLRLDRRMNPNEEDFWSIEQRNIRDALVYIEENAADLTSVKDHLVEMLSR